MPGKTDTMTRDVRASLRACAAKGGKYFKGTAALFLRSGSEYVSGQLPTLVGMVDTNREILQDTARFLRNPVDSINRTVNKAMDTPDFKAFKKFAANALNDLKTGNLYDPDRVRSGFGEEVDGLLDSFGDFDMSGFDSDGDWSEPEGEEEWEKQLKLAEAQEDTKDARTEATIDAIGTSTEAIVATSNANAQTNIRMSLKQHSQLMSAAQNMITQQAAAVQAVNQTATSILEITREAHNQVIDNLKGITALLTEIKQNTAPPVQEKDRVREPLEVFGAHGEINIANLLKSAKKKADDKYHISSMLSMATGGMSIADILETVGNDPWQIATDVLFKKMLPDSLKRQFEVTGKKLEGFFPALLTKWGEAGKRFDNGESESMIDFMKGLFGYDERSRKYIDTSTRNPTAPAVFTNKTAKAVEEVIPALISQLHTDLTGDQLKAFNYNSGQFEKVIDIISQQTYSANDLANRMGSAAAELIDMTKAVKFSDVDMEKRFDRFRYQFLQKAAEDNRFLDPYMDRDKFREAGPRSEGGLNETEIFSDIIQRALLNMGQAGLENLSAEIIDARRSRNSANSSINNGMRDNGQIIAFSGLVDRALQNSIESKTKRVGGGLRSDELDDVVQGREDQLERAGIPKANNITLKGIRDILERGIITYTYILGGSRGMDDVAKGNALAAQRVSQSGWDARTKRIIKEKEAKGRRAKSTQDENNRRAVKMKDPTRGPAEVYIGGSGLDWSQIDTAMKFNQVNRAERDKGELIIDNVGVKKFERTTLEGERALAKKQAELSEKINNRLNQTGIRGFQARVQEYGKVPFELVENGLKLVDSFLFRILYGEDASEVLLDGHKLPSVLDAVRLNVKAQWLSAKSWFAENIGNPLKHSLFDAKEGIIPQVGNRLNQYIAEPVKKGISNTKSKLIGTRETNEEGKPVGDYKGGKFSDQINKIRNRTSEIVGGAKNHLTGTAVQGGGFFDRILYGKIKEGDSEAVADGVLNRTRYRYSKGRRYAVREQSTEYGWKEFDPVLDGYVGAVGAFKHASDKLSEIMFGPDEDGDDHGSRAKFELVKDELHKSYPDMIIGAGLGVVGSLFLPGGPVLGALLGSASGFLASSERFKTYLFGDVAKEDRMEFNWETGKIDKKVTADTRTGGVINKEVYDAFKKFAPKIALGSGLGVVGSLFLPGGPFIGALMGGIGGMTMASDRMKQLLFGTYTDENGNEQDGLLGPKARKAIANAAGPALGGAAIGAASWGLISQIGLIPGLSLLPGGPVFALLGGITGAMNADAIKNFFFGEEAETTEEVKDKDGNPTGQTRKVKRRVGGLFGRAFDFARDMMLNPFAQRINAAGAKVGEWFTSSVVTPFQHAIQPMRDQIRQAGTAISDSMKNIGEHIKDSIAKMFSNPKDPEDPREQMKKFFKEKIINPMDKLVSGIFNTIGRVIGSIVSAPFKAMEFIFAGTIGGKTIDEISDDRARAKAEKERERNAKRAERMANRRTGLFSRISDGISKRFGSIVSRHTGRTPTAVSASSDMPPETPDYKAAGDIGDTVSKSKVVESMRDEVRRATEVVEANRGPAKDGVNVSRNRNQESADDHARSERDRKEDATRDERDRLQRNAELTSSGAELGTSTTNNSSSSSGSSSSADAGTDGGPAKRRGFFRGKSNNGYLKDIARSTEKIFNEINGQLGGSGWNIVYIKTLLDKKFGRLSAEELPEEMEGSKSVKKRRGIFGRAKDRVFGILGATKDRVESMIEGAINIVLTPFKAIGSAIDLVKDGVVGAAKTMWSITKTAGSILRELALGAAKGIGGVLAGAGKMISGAAKGFGRALGDVLSTVTGVLHDGILAISGVVSGAIQFAGAMIPEVGIGVWNAMKFIGKGAGKVAGAAWKGITGAAGMIRRGVSGAAGWVADKLTGRKRDKTDRPISGAYPITISTKAASANAMPFPVISTLTPTKPAFALPVFLVGAFKDAIVSSITDSDEGESGTDGPTPKASKSVAPVNSGNFDNASDTPKNGQNDERDRIKELVGNSDSGNAETANIKQPAKQEYPQQEGPQTTVLGRMRQAAQNRFQLFKKKYMNVDRKAERASSPGEAYDDAIKNAQNMDEVEAIQAAQQMNANNQQIVTGDAEKKSGGILGMLATALGTLLGGGGIKGVIKAIAAKTGISAILKNAGKVFGSTLVDGASIGADIFQIGSDKGNTLWGLENLAHKGGKIAKAVVGGADDAARLGPVQKAIAKVIRSLLNNPVVKKMFGALSNKIGPLTTKLTAFISDKVLKKAMQTGAGKAIKSSLKQIAAWGSGGIIAVGFAIADFVSGFGNAKKYFNVYGSDVSLGMRLTSAVVNTLGGLLGLIPVAGSFLSVAVAMMQDDIVQLVYGILADDESKRQLAENQAELQAATEAYNAENGTNLSVDEYSKRFNKNGTKRSGILGSIGAGISKIGGMFESAAKATGGVFGAAAKTARGVIGGIGEAVSNPGKFFGETLPFMIGQTAGHVYNFGTSINKGLNDLFGKMREKLIGIKDDIGNFFVNAPKNVSKWLTNTWSIVKTKAAEIKNNVVGFVSGIPGKVITWASNTWASVTEKAGAIKDSVVNFVTGIPERIKGFFENIWDKAKGVYTDAKEWVTNAGSNVSAGFTSVTGKGPGDDAGSSMLTGVKSIFSDPNKLFNIFTSIGGGIGSSLINMVTNVFRDKKKGPTIFSIMGEGLGNSLVADLKNTEGKNATITTAMSTAVASTVTAITPVKEKRKGWFGRTVDKVKGVFGKGTETDDGWGTGATPMSQTSGKWNRGSDSIAKTGCGPTAAAIVASAYGAKNANPREADTMSRRMGMRASDGGTNPNFYSGYAASHGFSMRQGPVDAGSISSSLQSGRPVVMMGKGGAYGKNMHYMVAETGKGSSVGLIDPLTGSRKSATMGKLLGNTKTAVYSFGKGSGWGKGYGDEASDYDEYGNLKGVDDQNAASLAARTGMNYTEAKTYSKSGGNPLSKPFKVTSPFGTRTLNGKVEGHKGIDIVPADGSRQAEVGSRWNGTISYVKNDIADSYSGLNVRSNTGGNMVFIETDDGYTIKHMHLKAGSIPDAIVKGATVKIGQKLGEMGSTGRSTGPHLHYQMEDKAGIPFNPYSSISGGSTMAGFTDGYTTAKTGATAAKTSADGTESTASTTGSIGAAGILSAIGTVFSSVSSKLGGILSILLGGNPVDDGADSETSGDTTTDQGTPNADAASGSTNGSFNFGTSAGAVTPTESKGLIWKWLRRDYGLTEPATAGLMGCWENESGNRADRLEGDYLGRWKKRWSSINEVLSSNTNLNEYTKNYLFPAYGWSDNSGYRMADGNYYPGVGLAQWTKGRAYNLLNYAKSMGLDWRDPNTQLKFFRYETSKSFPKLKDALNAATTPEDAARAALDGFEMYEGWSNKPKGKLQWATRAKSAAQIYNTYKGTQVTDQGDDTKAIMHTGNETKSKSVDALKVPTMSDIANNAGVTATPPGAAGVGGEADEKWGTGATVNLGANVQALNRQISQINKRMEKVREDANKETTVAEVTRKITEAMTTTSGSDTSKTDKLLAGFATMMAQMVEHLAAIRENTEKKDTDTEEQARRYPRLKTGMPIYPNGENEVDDVGAATINSMTGL